MPAMNAHPSARFPRRELSLALVATASLAALACSPPPPPPPDAGVDTSCGLDCEAQQRYGLIVDRCFEYSGSSMTEPFPAMGAYVRPVRELEGGVKVIPVEYSQNGVLKMEDNFLIRDGALVLARRVFKTAGGSVTYKDASGAIIGADWWQADTAAGQNFTTSATADFIDTAGTRESQPTEFNVVASESSTSEKTVPLGKYDNAVTLVFNEQPSHGMDTRRVFADGTGFIFLSTSFSSATTSGTGFRLQGIRDVNTADGGTHPCGLTP